MARPALRKCRRSDDLHRRAATAHRSRGRHGRRHRLRARSRRYVAGRVREQETNLAIDDGFVEIFDATGTRGPGAARLGWPLPGGRPRRRNVPCDGDLVHARGTGLRRHPVLPGDCDITNATPIEVARGRTRAGHRLLAAARVLHRGHRARPGAPFDITVEIRDDDGNIFTPATSCSRIRRPPSARSRPAATTSGRTRRASGNKCSITSTARCIAIPRQPARRRRPFVGDARAVARVRSAAARVQCPASSRIRRRNRTRRADRRVLDDDRHAIPVREHPTEVDGSYHLTGLPAGAAWLVVTSIDHRDTAYPDAPCNDFMYGESRVAISLGDAGRSRQRRDRDRHRHRAADERLDTAARYERAASTISRRRFSSRKCASSRRTGPSSTGAAKHGGRHLR